MASFTFVSFSIFLVNSAAGVFLVPIETVFCNSLPLSSSLPASYVKFQFRGMSFAKVSGNLLPDFQKVTNTTQVSLWSPLIDNTTPGAALRCLLACANCTFSWLLVHGPAYLTNLQVSSAFSRHDTFETMP